MKSKLQFDIDNAINKSKNWEDFLNRMVNLGYAIKDDKHITFKHKDKERFTRAKTIGEDYTEERLKELITKRENIKISPNKKSIDKVINMNNNAKVTNSKGYEY